MVSREYTWRYNLQNTYDYDACKAIPLDVGLLLSESSNLHVVRNAVHYSKCYEGVPLLSASRKLDFKYLPMIADGWQQYSHSSYGTFRYSVFPVIYSITSSAVVTWFLTLLVYTKYTSKPSILLKLSTLFASVYFLVLFVKAIVLLNDQQSSGSLSGAELIETITRNVAFNIIDLIVILFLQINQVQIIMRLFSRQREKRLTFIVGLTLSLISQVIWGVSTFSTFPDDEDSTISILPAFIYLLRIAMSVVYSALVTIYAVTKISFVMNRSAILLSLLTIVVVNTSIAFFIADVANVWVSELSDLFNTASYVVGTVIPWEWINRIHQLERVKEKEGILGRRFYEDELNKVDRFGLFVEEESPETLKDEGSSGRKGKGGSSGSSGSSRDGIVPSNSISHEGTSSNTLTLGENINENKEKPKKPQKLTEKVLRSLSREHSHKPSFLFNTYNGFKHTLQTTTDNLMYFTDQIIAIGLAVPRSVSTNSQELPSSSTQSRQEIPRTRAPRKDVFVYAKKEVICEDENVLDLSAIGLRDEGSPGNN